MGLYIEFQVEGDAIHDLDGFGKRERWLGLPVIRKNNR